APGYGTSDKGVSGQPASGRPGDSNCRATGSAVPNPGTFASANEVDEKRGAGAGGTWKEGGHGKTWEEEGTGKSRSFGHWDALRTRLGINPLTWEGIKHRAECFGVPVQAELLASGVVTEEALVSLLSQTTGIRALSDITAEGLIITEKQSLQA